MSRARATYAATLATGIAIGLAAFGMASAAPAAPAPNAAVHHYTLAASAFAPDSPAATTAGYFNSWNPSSLQNTDSGRCFNVGLALPNGARLKSVTIYFTKGGSAMSFQINRQKLATHTFSLLTNVTTRVNAGTPFYTSKKLTIKASAALVNTSTFGYSAGACPLGTTKFSGLSIAYTG